MLRVAVDSGTTDIVATPHANAEYVFDSKVVEERARELALAAPEGIRIFTGCDLHLSFENVQDALAHPTRYTINHGRYLLVEFPDLTIFARTAEIFERLLAAGMIPIITHPERNALLQQKADDLARWVEMGCVLQVTAGSFLGRWGNRARQFSLKLLDRGLVHVVASDAHDPEDRRPSLREVHEFLTREYSPVTASQLTLTNPRAILESLPLPDSGSSPAAGRRSWYRFWGS